MERGYPLLVLFNAGDLMTEIGKEGPGDEPHISGADHSYTHRNTLALLDQPASYHG
jgi:hypothetical protein